ncbi:MAG TPA: glutamate-cysteine ligase family protein, partial [Methylocella sp.]|nr:glutamate-cysteine ligase family protein [Methylocella sp.]
MARDVTDTTPITSRDALVAWIESGEKPSAEFRIGTEHEKFAFYRNDLAPVPYEGRPFHGVGSIKLLLEGMQSKLGWEPVSDNGHIIGLFDAAAGAAISLEPGGQFELSGAPLDTIHEMKAELEHHLSVLKAIAEPMEIGFLG